MKAIRPVWMGFKHQIQEILVLNLKERMDRYHAVYGALHAAGANTNDIKRWEAMPASDYKDTAALVDAAVKDGFPEFQTLFENNGMSGRSTKNAQFWSYCQMLRYIAERNITAVILYDDRYITNWSQLANVYSCMKNIEDNPDSGVVLDVLQLEYYHDDHHQIVNIYTHPDKFSVPYPCLPYILQGPLGQSENAMLFTPNGAKFFLQRLLNFFNDSIEHTLIGLIDPPVEERNGFWTCNYPAVGWIPGMGSNMYKDDMDRTDEMTIGGR